MYAVAPDYAYANVTAPLVGGIGFEFSKDRHLYFSWSGPGKFKNWSAGAQAGIAYFATTHMSEEERDQSISGPGLNLTSGPVGGYIPKNGTPAFTLGLPFTKIGVNVSSTRQLF